MYIILYTCSLYVSGIKEAKLVCVCINRCCNALYQCCNCLLKKDDHSRVKLQQIDDDDPTSDYINANYIPVSFDYEFCLHACIEELTVICLLVDEKNTMYVHIMSMLIFTAIPSDFCI